jgi:hypothetical protein
VRRGAAWPPAERPSGRLPVQQALPRAGRWPHCRASWLSSAACAAHSNTVRRPSGVVVRRCPIPTVPCSPCPRHPSASVCPASTRPASGVCPVSARLVSDARCPCPGPRAQCPTSDVRCPVSASGIRACRVRVHSIRTGKFVEREGAAGSHTPRDRPGRRLTLPICRAAGARRFAHCGRLRAGRQERAAGGPSRPESLGRGSSALGSPWPTA